MLFRHIRFHIIVVWECLKEAFRDDEGRTDTGVIVTGYSPIQCDKKQVDCLTHYVIVTGYSPIQCDSIRTLWKAILVIVTGYSPIQYDWTSEA